VGDVKAGKSTFINALLGQEILPVGTLQCTSAIIEIHKSDKISLKVVYGDGKSDEIFISDPQELREKLDSIAKINDKDPNIPATLIDSYILKDHDVNDILQSIPKLEEESGLKLENEKPLIEKYVTERRKRRYSAGNICWISL